MIRFCLALAGCALALGAITWIAFWLQWVSTFPSFFYQTTLFLLFSTVTIFAYLYYVEKPEFFVQLYLLTMAVKLVAYGTFNVLMIVRDQAGAAVNVVYFMALYVAFTVLEIAFLYRKISGAVRG